VIVAHGVGGRQDLPIPLGTAILGAVIALIVSFTVLAVATTRRRELAEPTPGPQVRVPLFESAVWLVVVRIVGMAFLALGITAALGPDESTNPIFGMVFVWWWVGLIFASLILGPVWRAASPNRTIHWLLSRLRGSEEPLFVYDERLGYWPATIGLLAFTWLELVYPNNGYLGPVRLWCVVYFVVMLLGGQLWGKRFFERCDPFEVYSSLVARLSVWGRDDEGRVVLRRPMSNLDTLQPEPGLVAVVSVLFGTIVFDSFKESIPWLTFTQGTPTLATHGYLVDNVALVAFPVAVGIFFCAGTMLTGVDAGGVRRRDLPGLLAPSMVPIVAGYVVAHYLTYWWSVGQLTLSQASDPLGNGSNWFGTANWGLNATLSYHPQLLADVKVLSVIVGHVLGVVSAHRRAVRALPPRHVITGQLPLLVTMIGFTVGGLYLLFAA